MPIKYIMIAATVLTTLTAGAQSQSGIKVTGGVSELVIDRFYEAGQIHKTYLRPSGQAGFYFDHRFYKRFSFGAELIFSQIEGREYLSFNGKSKTTTYFITENTWYHISYLALPLYCGYQVGRLNINLGIQVQTPLASGGFAKGKALENGNLVDEWENTATKLNTDDVDYGLRAGLTLKITERFSAEANYFHGLNNIMRDAILSPQITWEVRQLTLGIRMRVFGKQLF